MKIRKGSWLQSANDKARLAMRVSSGSSHVCAVLDSGLQQKICKIEYQLAQVHECEVPIGGTNCFHVRRRHRIHSVIAQRVQLHGQELQCAKYCGGWHGGRDGGVVCFIGHGLFRRDSFAQ